MEVEFADGGAIGKRRPLHREGAIDAEDVPTALRDRVGLGHRPCHGHRPARHGGDCDCRIVDDPVDHHVGDLRADFYRVGGKLRQLIGEVFFQGEIVG